MSTKTQIIGILLQYQILTPSNRFQELQYTKARLKKFSFICQVERRKIRSPWHNTCQSIRLKNIKMKQFLPLIDVGCLSELP